MHRRLLGTPVIYQGWCGGGNRRYIHEIDEPDLLSWAHRNGFTIHELARIQQEYGFTDHDNDDWLSDEDCDDNDRNISPGEVEVCDDDVDNDCDGEVDEAQCAEKGCSSLGLAPIGPLAMLPLLLVRRRR